MLTIIILGGMATFFFTLFLFELREEKKSRLHQRLSRPKISAQIAGGEKILPRSLLEKKIVYAGFDMSEAEFYAALCLAGSVTLGIVSITGLSLVLGVPLAVGVGITPLLYINRRAKQRHRILEKELENFFSELAGSLRANPSPITAVREAGKRANEPLKSELKRTIKELDLNVSFPDALRNLAERNKSDILRAAVEGIVMAHEGGGDLVKILERASKIVRDNVLLKEEIRALSSQPRSTAMVIVAILAFFVGVLSVSNPEYVECLKSPIGTLVLAYAVVSISIGLWVMNKMCELVKEGGR